MLQQKIAKQAAELRRRVYASLPLHIRLAHIYIQAAGHKDTFGRLMYAIFLMRGVQDMPDIKGVPAEEVPIKSVRDVSKLPANYGKEFGHRAIGTAFKSFYRFTPASRHRQADEVVDEAVSEVMINFLKKTEEGHLLRPNTVLPVAEGYVIQALKRKIKDLVKLHRFQQPEQSMTTEEGGTWDFASLEDLLGSLEGRRAVKRYMDVGKDDRERQLLQMRLEGYTNREMAQELGITDAAVSMWWTRHRRDIEQALSGV